MIQVHNGSLADLKSPPVQNQQSSDVKPVNIMLGSCTRFPIDPSSGRNMYSAAAAAVDEEEANNVNNIRQMDQPVMAQTSDVTKTAATNGSNAISRFDNRKASQESGTKYRSNLRTVRPRVDCWNRSATRGEATPSNRQMVDVAKVDTYRKSDSGIKTPVHGASRVNSGQAAPIMGSFTNIASSGRISQQIGLRKLGAQKQP